MAINQLIILLFCVGVAYASTKQYVATVHHSNSEYLMKRNVQDSSFVGDLIFNNTINENGEVTISLCDITKDLFGSIPSLNLFNLDRSASVGSIATAELKASLNAQIKIDGCLVFFFNPCCKTLGVKVSLDDPVVLSASGAVEVDLKAFNLGINVGNDDITINPLQNINLGGISPVIGSWNLPPILDQFVSIRDRSLCAKLGIPGSNVGLDFCVVLGNFSAGVSGVNVCPRLTVSFGTQKLLDISYTAFTNNATQCLTLDFLPTCSYNGASVSPDIVQLFKSSDTNNDQKILLPELEKAKALLGIFDTKNANTASFSEMDSNNDGEVDFTEFEKYTATQTEIYNQQVADGKEKKEGKKFSGGHIAAAVIVTMIGTILIGGVVIAIVAQSKGIINNKWLGKVTPSK